MKGSKIPRFELNTVYLYEHYWLFMPNKLLYAWRGNYCECVRPAQLWVCAACPTASVCGLPNSPSWLKFEHRPSWNNIHDTFPTGTAQDTTGLRVFLGNFILSIMCFVNNQTATLNQQNSQDFSLDNLRVYHNEYSYNFRPTMDHHQGTKLKQYDIKTN
jgi:hypothetical protein